MARRLGPRLLAVMTGGLRWSRRSTRASRWTWLADITRGRPGGWAGYPAGVVDAMRQWVSGGVSVLVDGDVPAGMGLSSSAALSCSIALDIRDLAAPELALADLVDIARRAENDFVGARTGILDQSASLLCAAGHALFLHTRDRCSEQLPFDLEAGGLALLVVDTGTTHRHADGGYGDRRRECEQAAERLGVPALRDVADLSALVRLDDGTAEGAMLLRRARHVVTENARVLEVVARLRGSDGPRSIGPVLTAGHASSRDDLQISTPELDTCVAAALEAGAVGARMVGGGFGGSAIVLVDVHRIREIVTAIVDHAARQGHRPPQTFTACPARGAHRLA